MSGHLAQLAALAAAALLLACGGGGSSDTGSSSVPASSRGSLTIGLIGSPAPGLSHAWVTVQSLAIHADANKPWSGADSSWQVMRLPQPLTLDLLSLVNGSTQPLVVGQLLPPGSYGQIRLFLSAHDAALTESAKTRQLSYNNQVEYSDAGGSARSVPLEIAGPALGLRLAGPFMVQANQDTDLTLQWDLERSLARFAGDDGFDRFTLRPELSSYDVANSGAIVGLVDKSLFCASGVRADGCIFDAVASALLTDADGRTKRSVRSVPLQVGSDYARFGLYPLPVLVGGQRFDVLIRGRHMRTLLIRGVPAPNAGLLGATPTWLGVSPDNPSVAQPIQPQLELQAEAAAWLTAPSSLGGQGAVRLLFTQTLAGESAALEISSAVADPFSGLLVQALPLSTQALLVAPYEAGKPLVFNELAPQEGVGGYSVIALGNRYQDAGAAKQLQTQAGATLSISPTAPTARAGMGSAKLTVTMGAASSGRFDAAQLLVSDAQGVVLTRDVSALLGGGSVELQLPAGAQAAQLGSGAEYALALRAWKRSAPSSSLQWVRAGSTLDLSSGKAATLTIQLP